MTMHAATRLQFDQPKNISISTQLTQPSSFSLPRLMANLASNAMMQEIFLTPKPGLVDARNNGAHNDMTSDTFIASINAISPYLEQFVSVGLNDPSCQVSELLARLRPIGIDAEKAMFKATRDINTHKGMIFIMGLICGAVGWLRVRRLPINACQISEVISDACQGLVQDELAMKSELVSETAGERIYQQYGICGARGEAASGLQTIMHCALPAYKECIGKGATEKQAMLHTLITLMSINDDSNLVSRGGLEGLSYVKNRATELLKVGGFQSPNLEQALIDFDCQLIALNLSPGGSADLLAATWLIHELEKLFND